MGIPGWWRYGGIVKRTCVVDIGGMGYGIHVDDSQYISIPARSQSASMAFCRICLHKAYAGMLLLLDRVGISVDGQGDRW